MRAIDPRLLRHARAARSHLVVAVVLGVAVTGLILAQAALLAHALASAALGTGAAALAVTLLLLLGVVVARGAAAYGGEAAALRAAAAVKSQLRRKLTGHCLRLGPAWLGGQQPGRIAALATRGHGMSTLLRLLLRFTEPASGTVHAGRADLAAVPVDGWRAQIAWVPQQPRLFPGSVAGNIALGQPGASRAAIEEAARLAGAAAFIEALPRGYDTLLAERAAELSAGQTPAARPGPRVPAGRPAAAARRAHRPPGPRRHRRDR